MANCNILLVDDDIEDYLIMKEAFEDLGAAESLMYVKSGQEALAFLENQYESEKTVPDIVVLDINMPVMNGPAVLKSMRADKRFAKIPVVIYSTAINPRDEAQCNELGAEYCFTKPGKLEEIIKVGATLLNLCKKTNHAAEQIIVRENEQEEINRQLLLHELEVIEEAVVEVDGVEMKSGQCFHIESDPPHVLFNENCPESLKMQINEILKRYGVSGIIAED